MSDNYDLIIAGAGVAGLCLANICAKVGVNILIVDPKAEPAENDTQNSDYDARVLAITRRSEEVLANAGILDKLLENRHGVFEQMLVWDSNNLAKVEFSAIDYGLNKLGFIIENSVLVKTLWKNLKQCSNVTFVRDPLANIISNLNYKLLVGADGANSYVRNLIGTKVVTHDYKQHAYVATIESQIPHDNIARQIFLPTGPLAFLPLDKPNLTSIVWSNEDEITDNFDKYLEQAFQEKLGKLKVIGKIHKFPLRLLHAKNYIGDKVALIGDAAHVIHPLAGLGANLGIMDAASLGKIINDAYAKNYNIGLHQFLRKYERSRKTENFMTQQLMSLFKYSFGSKNEYITILRDFALNFCDNNKLIKSQVIKATSG